VIGVVCHNKKSSILGTSCFGFGAAAAATTLTRLRPLARAPRRHRLLLAIQRSSVTRHSWRSASVGGDSPTSTLIAALSPTRSGSTPCAGSVALLIVPRKRGSELSAIVAEVETSLGPETAVLAVLSGSAELSIGIVAQGGCAAAVNADTLQQDLDILSVASAGATTMLVLADPAASPSTIASTLAGLDTRFPDAAKVGTIAAPTMEKGKPAIGGLGGACRPGGLVVLALTGSAALDVCSYKPLGPELEVFEAFMPRGAPCVVSKIGTDEEGRIEDAEETEKGTAGIARRVSIPAAAAVQSAMKEAGVASPKQVMLGVPGSAKSGNIPTVSSGGKVWSLFPWAGVGKDGSFVLGGKGPSAEGLCSKGALDWLQCFQPSLPQDSATVRLAHLSKSGGFLAMASAGAPAGVLKALVAEAGSGVLILIGASLLGVPEGTSGASSMHGRAVAAVAPASS